MRATHFLFFSLLITVEGFARQPFQVGSLVAPAGQSASGFLEVPEGIDKGTRIPITVFNGLESGPTLALIAGNHGYEYSPVLALQRLRSRLSGTKIQGVVLMVHVANLPSLIQKYKRTKTKRTTKK